MQRRFVAARHREDTAADEAMPPLGAFLPDPLEEFATADVAEFADVADQPADASRLGRLGSGLHAVVIGASGGIGSALTDRLCRDPAVAKVFAFSRSPFPTFGGKIVAGHVDVELERSIERAAAAAAAAGPIHAVFVATGRLDDGTEGGEALPYDDAALALAFKVNAIAPMMIAKHFIPMMAPKSVFTVLSDDLEQSEGSGGVGWNAYRASKAALNTLIRSLARELADRGSGTICAGLHPGPVDTLLSHSLLAAVPDDDLISPDAAAQRLVDMASDLAPADSGEVVAWDSSRDQAA